MYKCVERRFHVLVTLLHVIITVTLSFGVTEVRAHDVPQSARLKRQDCGASFICESGQCIDFIKVCDGVADCDDSTDETRKTCTPWNKRCPQFSFQCSYGACIDGGKLCDGKVDCVDESDERVFGCTTLSGVSSSLTNVSQCTASQFTCSSGQCVGVTSVCNGKKDCLDGSDETPEKCQRVTCTSNSFRCAYGACININEKCDGEVQCSDSSDEDPLICKTTKPSTSNKGCVMPGKPENGDFFVGGCEDGTNTDFCSKTPGTSIHTPVLLNYTCDVGYQINGNSIVFCDGQKWIPSPPKCVPATCPPLVSSSVNVECKYDGALISCENPMPYGTVAEIWCKTSYQLPAETGYRKIHCGANGQWNPPIFRCTPVCGVRIPKGTPAISHGNDAEVGDFPWHVGIYKNGISDNVYKQICGGSLISDNLVISSAHCFWDRRTNKQLPKERFRMAVGKYNRDFYFPDSESQYLEPEDIKVPQRYKGPVFHYRYDIALIILSVSVDINWAVSPVCIDWENKVERFVLIPENLGTVTGWGVTENQTPSPVIKSADLPYIDFQTCYNTVPENFKSYVTEDKFCAGYTNGTSVCPGDSGGGLVFERDNTYYLMGVVSVGVAPEGDDKCFTNQYTAFTQVSKYLQFLEENSKIDARPASRINNRIS